MTTDPGRPALLDVNVLVAMSLDQHVHHRAARRRFREVADDWATCAMTECGLLRVLMTPAVVGRAVVAAEAIALLSQMHAMPGWRWLDDDGSFATSTVDTRVLATRAQVTDLHLVDLAARHGRVLCTFDAGIAQTLAPADRSHVATWSA